MFPPTFFMWFFLSSVALNLLQLILICSLEYSLKHERKRVCATSVHINPSFESTESHAVSDTIVVGTQV